MKKKKYIDLVLISDTHGKHHELTNYLNNIDDSKNKILIHAGDISNVGKPNEIEDFLKWYELLSSKYKKSIFINGNHDFMGERFPELFRKLLKEYPKLIYLENSSVTINGFKIYGSPYQPTFYNWAFNKDRGPEIRKEWDKIPDDTDILITHGPPKGYGDLVNNRYQVNEHVGCKDLLDRINELPNLLLNLVGHIHSGHGIYQHSLKTTIINASVLDESYQYAYKPIEYRVTK